MTVRIGTAALYHRGVTPPRGCHLGICRVHGKLGAGPTEALTGSRTPFGGGHRSEVPVHAGLEEHEQEGRPAKDNEGKGAEG